MPTVAELDAVLSAHAPRSLSESWDNDGIQLCADTKKNVRNVLTALEVSPALITFAAENGFDAVVTHHPFIFKPLAAVTGADYAAIRTLMASDISVLCYHTRMDAAVCGVNDVLAAALSLSDVRPFGGESGQIGKIGKLTRPLDAQAFAALLKTALSCGGVRYSPSFASERLISTGAVVGGAGKSFLSDAFSAGADAFVTGELSHNAFLDAASLGIYAFECGHYYTENPVTARLKALIDEAFGDAVTVECYDVGCPYAER